MIKEMFNCYETAKVRRNFMGHIIAISGKGGVGKTTLCGLLIQYLCETGKKPVLAVDADVGVVITAVLNAIRSLFVKKL